MALLSVIVPVYDEEKYIEECLTSIIENSYRDMEVIVVDDGSVDNSLKICRDMATKYDNIKVIVNNHEGLVKTRLSGLEVSGGEYVAFVDADDFVDKEIFATLMKVAQDGYDMVYSMLVRYHGYRNDNKRVYEKNYIERKIFRGQELVDAFAENLLWDWRNNHWGVDPSLCGKIMKRDLLLKIMRRMKDLDIFYGEDAAAVYPYISAADSLYVMNEHMYYHRQYSEGLTDKSYINDDDYFAKLNTLYRYFKKELPNKPGIRRQLDYWYMHGVNLKQFRYNWLNVNRTPVFPFDLIKKGERIVLYGAGYMGRTYYWQLCETSYCDIVLWTDKNYEKLKLPHVTNTEKIFDAEFDKIVIAVNSESAVKEITKGLLRGGVEPDKIISAFNRQSK